MKRRLLPVLLTLAFLHLQALTLNAQELRLPSILSDHMVLQRDQPVAVWGWAEPGSEVAVSFKGQSLTTTADDDGTWRVNLEPLDADAAPASMTVTSDDQTLTVSDILVGEVWLCSGQSNMQWALDRADNAQDEIATANWPQIRHVAAPRRPSMTPMEDTEAAWEVCSPDTAAKFTAVGYFFGRTLHNKLDVPVGLVNCSWGGTRIEPWVSLHGYANTPSLKDLYQTIAAKQPDNPAYQTTANAYFDSLNDWLSQSRQQLQNNAPIPEPQPFPDQLKPYASHQDPTMLYNGMIRPFIPYTLRGSIWYQGESNRNEGKVYTDLTRAQLIGWRKAWEQPNLPYYYVQIAPYQYGNENPSALAEFWETQAEIEKQIEHTGMVVINDIADLQDIHPTNKQDVGKRLAHMALKRTYGHDDLIDSGPRYESMHIEGNKLILTFTNAGDGLASRDGKPLTYFEIAGEAQPWTTAKAEITAPNTLTLSAEGITTPVAVRFAWHKLAEPNLVNSVGLPTAPFRAGNPPKLDVLSLNVPESQGYEIVYEKDLSQLGKSFKYETDHSAAYTGPATFDRIAYFLELNDNDNETRWVYVSMDAFTDQVKMIGVPTLDTDALFQQPASNLNVHSNVQGLPNVQNAPGNIEFWPNNYGKSNAANVPGAANNAYDTGDQISANIPDGYGCMQVHLTEPAVTVFALNNWKSNTPDLGIGTNTEGGEPDWTFTKSADRYTIKSLKILVRPTNP